MIDYAWLIAPAFLAGWVDAVIGGGGLILVPALLSAGLAPSTALGTNKLSAVFGTASAALVLVKKVGAPLALGRFIVIGLLCSGLGVLLASSLAQEIMRPIVIVLLLVVGIFIAVRPQFGQLQQGRKHRRVLLIVLVSVISFYDGIFGPGTGMFLIMAFTACATGDFLHSSVMAKVVNTCTNAGALLMFIFLGHVYFLLGASLAVATILGAQLGARTVIGGGARFVRIALVIMVIVMATKLGIDSLSGGAFT
ncbi:MAG: TSUP family transporter [Corynebacterium sp.]|uniref:TSUP family transporter n=1 Tax=Corynebacterium sp. TaxID=1720 RepID=UPI0026DC1980|nr:TSUP family transporter [Corynebacterium sp.]MDO4761089.1 TSUP family transporter [Corynebacterium sp.]